MKNETFVDSIKSKDLKGALRRIKSRINGLKNNSLQSLAVIPSDNDVRRAIDSMSLGQLEQAEFQVEERIRKESIQ